MQPLSSWHDFYMLLGQASATMTGLLFVAASVGSGIFSPDRPAALRMFLSASVVQFVCVLITCLLAIAPAQQPGLVGFGVAGCGVFGLFYAALAWHGSRRDGILAKVDWEDRLWYAVAPPALYFAEFVEGLALREGMDGAAVLLAATSGAQLAVAIHNAWDMTVWSVTRRKE